MEHHFPVVHFENGNRKTDTILTPVKSNKSRQSTLLKHSGTSDHDHNSSSKKISRGCGPSNDINNSTTIHKEKRAIKEPNSSPSNDVPLFNTDLKQEPVVSIAEPPSKQDSKNMKTVTTHKHQGPSTIEATDQQQDNEKQKHDSTVKFFFEKRMSSKKISNIFQAMSKKTSKTSSEAQIEHLTLQSFSKDDTKADVKFPNACSSLNCTSKTMKGKKRSEKYSFGNRFGFVENLHSVDKKKYTLFDKDKKKYSQDLSKLKEDTTCLYGNNNIVLPKNIRQRMNTSISHCIAGLSATNAYEEHHINSAIPHLNNNQDSGNINHLQFHTCIPNNDVILQPHDVNKKKSSRFWFPYDKRHIRLHGNKSKSALRTQVSTPSGERKKRRFRKRSKLRYSQMMFGKPNVCGVKEISTTNSDSQIRSRFLENQDDSVFNCNKRSQENSDVSPTCNLLEIESRYTPSKLRSTKYPSCANSKFYPIQEKILFNVTIPMHSRQNPRRSDRTSDLSSLSNGQQYANLRKVNHKSEVYNTDFDHGEKSSIAYIPKKNVQTENNKELVSCMKSSTCPVSRIVEYKNKKRSKSCVPPTINKLQNGDFKFSKLNIPSALKRRFGKALHESKKSKSLLNHSNKKRFSSSDNINPEHYLDCSEGICNVNNIKSKVSPFTKRKSTLLRFCLPEDNKHEILTSDKRTHKSNIIKKNMLEFGNNESPDNKGAQLENEKTINTLYLQRSKKPDQRQYKIKTTSTQNNHAAIETKSKIKANRSGKISYIQRKKNFKEYILGLYPKHAKNRQATTDIDTITEQENITSNTTKYIQASYNVKESCHLPADQCAYNTRVCKFEKDEQQIAVGNLKKRYKKEVPIVSIDLESYTKKETNNEKQMYEQPREHSTINNIQKKSKSETTDLRIIPHNEEIKKIKNHPEIKYVQRKKAMETSSIDTESQKTSIADTQMQKEYYTQRNCQSSVKRIQAIDETVKSAKNLISEHKRNETKNMDENQQKRDECNTAKYMHVKNKTYSRKLNAENMNGNSINKTTKHDYANNENNKVKLMNHTFECFSKHNTVGVCTINTTKSETSITHSRKLKQKKNQKLRSRRVKYVQRKYVLTDIGLNVKGTDDIKNPSNKNRTNYEINQLKAAKDVQKQNRAQLPNDESTFAKKDIKPSSSVIYLQNETIIDSKNTLLTQNCIKSIEKPENAPNRKSELKYIQRRTKSKPLNCQEKKQMRNIQENQLGLSLITDSIECARSYAKPKKNDTQTLFSHKSVKTVIPYSEMTKLKKIKQLFFLHNTLRGKLRKTDKEEFIAVPGNRNNSFEKKDQGVQYICVRCTSHETRDSTPKTSICDFGQQSKQKQYVQRRTVNKDKSYNTQYSTPKTCTCNFGQQSGKKQFDKNKCDFLINTKDKNKFTTILNPPKKSKQNYQCPSLKKKCVICPKKSLKYKSSTKAKGSCSCSLLRSVICGQRSGKAQRVQIKSVCKNAKKKDQSHKAQYSTPKTSSCNFGQQSGKKQFCKNKCEFSVNTIDKNKSTTTLDPHKKSKINYQCPSLKTKYIKWPKKSLNDKSNTKAKGSCSCTALKSALCGQRSGKTQRVRRKSVCKNTKKKDKSLKAQYSTPKTSTCNFGQQTGKNQFVEKTCDFSVKTKDKNESTTISDSNKTSKSINECPSLKTECMQCPKCLKYKSKTKAKDSCSCTALKNALKEKKLFLKEKRKFLKEKQKLLKNLKEKECQLARSKKPCKSRFISLNATTDKTGDREISISGRTNLVKRILKFMIAKSGGGPKKQKQTIVTLKTLKSSQKQSRALEKINICDTPKHIEKILETMDDNILDTKFNDGYNNQDLKKNKSFICDTVENTGVMPIVRGQKEIKISGPPKQVKKLLKVLSVTRTQKSANLRNKVTISLPGSGHIQVCGHKKNVKKMVKLLGFKKKKSKKTRSKAQLSCVSNSKHTYLERNPKNKKAQKCRSRKKSKGTIKKSKTHFFCPKDKKSIISKTSSKSSCKLKRKKLIKKEKKNKKKQEKFQKKICKKTNPKKRKVPKHGEKACISPCGSIKSKTPTTTSFSGTQICVPVQKGSQSSTIGMLLKYQEKSQSKKRKKTNPQERITVPIPEKKGLAITGTRRKVEKMFRDLSDAEILRNLRNSMCIKPCKVRPCDSVQTRTRTTTKFSGTQICLPLQTGSQVSTSSMLASDSDSFKNKSEHQNERKHNKPIFPNVSTEQLYIASTDKKRSEIFIQPSEIETRARKNSKKFNLCISAKVHKKGKVKYKQICIPAEEIATVSRKPDCPAYTRVCVKPKYYKKIKQIGFCNPRPSFESKDKTKKRRQSKCRDLYLKPTKSCVKRKESKVKLYTKNRKEPENIWKKIRGRKLKRCYISQPQKATPPMFVGNFTIRRTCFECCDSISRMFLLACTGCLWLPLICCYKLYCCIKA